MEQALAMEAIASHWNEYPTGTAHPDDALLRQHDPGRDRPQLGVSQMHVSRLLARALDLPPRVPARHRTSQLPIAARRPRFPARPVPGSARNRVARLVLLPSSAPPAFTPSRPDAARPRGLAVNATAGEKFKSGPGAQPLVPGPDAHEVAGRRRTFHASWPRRYLGPLPPSSGLKQARPIRIPVSGADLQQACARVR